MVTVPVDLIVESSPEKDILN